ncbi:DUF4145 domain-containing protein [Microbacterium sp. NPDC059771]|uniref:DUF4145 domain-containing protein n=1 Tax=Microbacterium sp. NPDC059771 TaxID=3346941 RepID=UPI003653B08F
MHHVLTPYSTWLQEDDWPRHACPRCGRPTLEPKQLTHHRDEKSDETVTLANQQMGPRDELSGTFEGHLACARSACGQAVSIAGDWRYVLDFDEDELVEIFTNEYHVRYMNPAPLLIDLPARTPAKVQAAVRAASEVVWLNASAVANQLRQAVEELLTAKKVKRQVHSAKNKVVKLKTHQRIELYRGVNSEVADLLEAVKWIGNSGSHESSLTVADVLNGAGYLALALRRLYDTSDAELLAQVKAVNKKRGPVRSS